MHQQKCLDSGRKLQSLYCMNYLSSSENLDVAPPILFPIGSVRCVFLLSNRRLRKDLYSRMEAKCPNFKGEGSHWVGIGGLGGPRGSKKMGAGLANLCGGTKPLKVERSWKHFLLNEDSSATPYHAVLINANMIQGMCHVLVTNPRDTTHWLIWVKVMFWSQTLATLFTDLYGLTWEQIALEYQWT